MHLPPFKIILPGLVLVSIGFVAGCGSPGTATRIQEKSSAYAVLSPEVQQGIQQGRIGRDFTPEMVYMSLGKPSTIIASADGREVTWTYMFFNTPGGAVFDYSKHITHNPNGMSRALTSDMTGVTGQEDLDNGEVAVPNDKVRRKTAMEMINSDLRRDLIVKFTDGKVSDVQTEIVSQ